MELQKKLNNFIYSQWFIITLVAIVYISWLFKIDVYGYVIMIGLMGLFFLLKKDLSPVMVILIVGPFIIQPLHSKTKMSDYFQDYRIAIIAAILTVIALILHFFIYRKRPVTGKFFYPLLAVSAAAAMGGIGFGEQYNPANFYWGLVFGLMVFVIYFIFRNYTDETESNDFIVYISRAFMWSGILVMLEMASLIIMADNPLHVIIRKKIMLSIHMTNSVSIFLFISMIFTLYLSSLQKKSIPYLAVAFLQIVFMALTCSRWGLFIIALLMPFVLFYYYKKSYDKKTVLISYGTGMVVLLIAAVFLRQEILTIITGTMSRGTASATVRFDLYKAGLESFLQNPLFGSGFVFLGQVFNKTMYLYHNTFIQIISSMGIAGIAAYAFKYYVTVKVLCCKTDTFNIFMIMAVIGLELFSLFDMAVFSPLPFMVNYVFILLIVEMHNKTKIES